MKGVVSMSEQRIGAGREAEEALPRPKAGWSVRILLTHDAVVAALVLGLVAAWIIPYLQLPDVLDGLFFIAGAEHIANNGFVPIPPAAWDANGHPVLLHELLALGWLVFGQATWVSHVVILPFAFALVWYTYRIASLLYDRRTGALAALFLLFYPLYRAQSTVFMLDLPAAALAMMAVYWVLRRNLLGYLVCGGAMVLTKETAVLLVPAVLVYVWAINRAHLPWRQLLWLLALHSVPVLVLAGWYLFHYSATGWFAFTNAEAVQANALVSAYLPSVLFTRDGAIARFFDIAFNYFGKWYLTGILSLLILAYSVSPPPIETLLRGPRSAGWLISAIKAQPVWRVWGPKTNLVLLGFPILLQLAFCAAGYDIQRYMMLQYGLFFILAARATVGFFGQPSRVAAFTLVVLAVFAIGTVRPWFGYSVASPSNLLYTDYVAAHQAAAKFIEQEYPDRTVLADWPAYAELSMPVQGYVSRPMRVLTWAVAKPTFEARMAALGGRYFTDPATVGAEDFDLLYYTEYRFGRDDRPVMLGIVQRLRLDLIAEFKTETEYIAIYGKPGVSALRNKANN